MVGWGGGSGHRELRIDGPRAEEDHALGRPVQGAQGFADGVVPDVAAGVEVEAVLACAPGGCSVGPTVGSAGPRLDAGEVDPAHGELVHRGHQAARGVGEVEDHRGSVGAGRLAGCAGLADEEEAGDGVVGVDHSLGQRDQPVQGGGRRRGDGGVGAALGDVLGGTDLRAILTTHAEKEADVTMHLVRVPDPRAFGCVPTSEDGRVLEFLEKTEDPPTDQINAGCYVFRREIIEEIPAGRVVVSRRSGSAAPPCSCVDANGSVSCGSMRTSTRSSVASRVGPRGADPVVDGGVGTLRQPVAAVALGRLGRVLRAASRLAALRVAASAGRCW